MTRNHRSGVAALCIAMLTGVAVHAATPVVTPLPNFDGTFDFTGAGSYTGANAQIPADAAANIAWNYDRSLQISPSALTAGQTATVSTTGQENAAALGGGAIDTFPTVYFGFMSEQGQAYNAANPAYIARNEIFGPGATGNPAFPDHDLEPILSFQGNSLGAGTAWNNRFYDAAGNFVFGSGQPLGGPTNGIAATNPIWVDLTATIFPNNTYTLSVLYRDTNGVPLAANLTGTGTNPEVFPVTALPHDASFSYFPEMRIYEATTAPTGWSFQISNTQFQIVPEPSTLALLASGSAGLYWVQRRRRRYAK